MTPLNDPTVNEWFEMSRRDQLRWVLSATDTEKTCLIMLALAVDRGDELLAIMRELHQEVN